jgi:hypothetical protein
MKNGIPIVKGDYSRLHRAAKPLNRIEVSRGMLQK